MKKQEDDFSWLLAAFGQVGDLKPGCTKIVKCPTCGGDMEISRAAYNGHLRIVCVKCKTYIVQ